MAKRSVDVADSHIIEFHEKFLTLNSESMCITLMYSQCSLLEHSDYIAHETVPKAGLSCQILHCIHK